MADGSVTAPSLAQRLNDVSGPFEVLMLVAVEWNLGLASWIIQDGNYGDVRRHDRLNAALEFGFGDEPALLDGVPSSARHVDGSTYEVIGRVVVVEADVWVIDCGILAFDENRPPQGLSVGDVVGGRAYLGIDPFFYFERLNQRASLPPLIYAWDVRSILRQTAPFVSVGPRMMARDASLLGWQEIEATDAWSDDDGNAEGCGSIAAA